MYNGLVVDVGTFIDSASDGGSTFYGQHLTVHRCQDFAFDDTSGMYFTNCLFVLATNFNTEGFVLTNATMLLDDDTGVFQAAGNGHHYLANNSPYRNAGVGIDPWLEPELRKLTTYPPVVLSNQLVTESMTMSPQAERDTTSWDLGYHYAPVDYLVGRIWVTNATLQVEPGTVVGVFGATTNSNYGISLQQNAVLAATGTADNLAWMVSAASAQETMDANWALSKGDYVWSWNVDASMHFRFVGWSMSAGGVGLVHAYNGNLSPVSFRDCQFWGGKLVTDQPQLNFTNCLFWRTYLDLNGVDYEINPSFLNNTFVQGAVRIVQEGGGTYRFWNNLFAQTVFTNLGSSATLDIGWNGYYEVTNRLTTNNDVVLTNLTFEVGPLGAHYLPTNSLLLNAGSTNAHLLGLYHHTITANQVKETNTLVDIGLHYVACGTNGLPMDTDGDGLADYIEDTDGDHYYDWSDWLNADTDGDGMPDMVDPLPNWYDNEELSFTITAPNENQLF